MLYLTYFNVSLVDCQVTAEHEIFNITSLLVTSILQLVQIFHLHITNLCHRSC